MISSLLPSQVTHRLFATLFAVMLVTGCTTAPEDPIERAAWEEANDPIEDVNRVIFDINMWLDRNFMKPVAIAYRDYVPDLFRDTSSNFFNNVRSPVTFVNDLLQFETGRAAETLMRLFVNSTAGMGGLFDVAGEMGLERHKEDFGQTLAIWGVPEGPYLMLPLIGPASLRHGVGRYVDKVFNPLFWVGEFEDPVELEIYGYVEDPIDALNQRVAVLDTLDEVERTSIDFYAAIRSLYRQRRQDEINNNEIIENLPAPFIISEGE